jgi:tetrapyrrole methylase family protein/MazG family protein
VHDTERGMLTIVGLGPGSRETLTLEADRVLREASDVWVRTRVQPALDEIERAYPEVRFHSFDPLYETLPSLDEVYREIVNALVPLAQRPEGVIYAVPGSPSSGETTVRLLVTEMERRHIETRLVQGIDYVTPVLSAVGISDTSWLEVIDAAEIALMSHENATGEVPGQAALLPWRAPVPTAPLVVSPLYDRETASGVKLWLGRYYPDGHEVSLVHLDSNGGAETARVSLHDIDRSDVDHHTALYVPPVSENDNVRTFAGLMTLTRTLRAPGGCPWDRDQTHETLKKHLLEETYEVLEALDSNDPEMLAEELGDLLFQVTIHSQVAAENGTFTIEDVIQNVTCKLIGRHPHVFGELNLQSAQDVLENWESFKQKEKPKRTSIFEHIPKELPALPQSNLMQKRAAGVGFEWPDLAAVLNKVEEEIAELWQEVEDETAKNEQREEFGDILFALVSVARHLHIDPEEALRLANRKFAARFQYVESRATAGGQSLRDLTPADLDVYWEEAKALGTRREPLQATTE